MVLPERIKNNGRVVEKLKQKVHVYSITERTEELIQYVLDEGWIVKSMSTSRGHVVILFERTEKTIVNNV